MSLKDLQPKMQRLIAIRVSFLVFIPIVIAGLGERGALNGNASDDFIVRSTNQNKPPGALVSVTIKTPKDKYLPLEVIELNLAMQNLSDHEIEYLGESSNYRIFHLEVSKEFVSVSRTKYFDEVVNSPQIRRSSTAAFQAKDFEKVSLVPNLVCDMTAPGKYMISASIIVWSGDPKDRVKIRSNTLFIQVDDFPAH